MTYIHRSRPAPGETAYTDIEEWLDRQRGGDYRSTTGSWAVGGRSGSRARDVCAPTDTAITDGDRAAVAGTFTGTHDGPLHTPSGPVTATGKTVTFRWSATYLVDLDATLLRSEHLYFDRLDFLTQLGLAPN